MSASYDVCVVGAGHNGLVTAGLLAGSGLRVVVLERREVVGGGAVTEELFPGFRVDSAAHSVGALHPSLLRELSLAEHGLELVPLDPCVFTPLPDGGHLVLGRDPAATASAIARLSSADAERWPAFLELVSRASGFLGQLSAGPPPDLPRGGAGELLTLVRLGARLRGLGRTPMMELLRVLPMSAAELLDEWFEADGLRGTIAAVGISGSSLGPMATGTAYRILQSHVGEPAGVFRPVTAARGGTGRLTEALAGAARARGAEIRTGARVTDILTRDGAACGAVLESGEEVAARSVVSSADPRQTFLRLVDPGILDPGFVRAVSNLRCRGTCAKVHLALGEPPDFTALPGGTGPHLHGVISISPSLEYLERAADDAKYGRLSDHPYLEVRIPTLSDPSLAPAGRHVMSVLAQYAPHGLKDGSWDDRAREALGDRVVRTLSAYCPNLEGAILHRHVSTPADIEDIWGLTEGQIHHTEQSLDQILFMRPVPGWARYGTPIRGLYLCGAGTHPGGGLTGYPGRNAARRILRDLRSRPQSA